MNPITSDYQATTASRVCTNMEVQMSTHVKTENYVITSNDSIEPDKYLTISPNGFDIFRNFVFDELKVDQSQLEYLKLFISVFQEIVSHNLSSLHNVGYIPPFNMHTLDDGSILVDWIFPDFRIGFSVETDVNNSNWYLVSNRKLGELSLSGLLNKSEFESIISNLLTFIINHI